MIKEHEYCVVCGRRLKNPKYRVLGFGPVCEKKRNNRKRRLFYEDTQSIDKAERLQESTKQK